MQRVVDSDLVDTFVWVGGVGERDSEAVVESSLGVYRDEATGCKDGERRRDKVNTRSCLVCDTFRRMWIQGVGYTYLW